ncbi:aminotransferase class V-fold PLP-dependent enzyme [Massilia sp. erpn]|nr:aminotransferase class V-fold PLP-dependent enzyme [Massilia sp. erpn]
MKPLFHHIGDCVINEESYWDGIAAQYDVAPGYVNLEHGYFGAMARPVMEEYKRQIELLNTSNTYFLREDYDPKSSETVRARIAAAVGCAPDEIALTRGATEALRHLIFSYRPLQAGDTVMLSDVDYDSMTRAMHALRELRGAEVVQIALPEAPTTQAILDAYAQAFDAHPRTRLLLLTHVSHKTGQLMPVAELAEMARARGIDTICDAAQSWGQIDFKVGDLKSDFAGFNLHKWMGAPLGVGFMYIRKERLDDIAIDPSGDRYAPHDIRARTNTGTTNTANVLTVPAALDFHDAIGGARKAARLRQLRDRWVDQVRGLSGLQLLVRDEAEACGGITSFRLAGQTGWEENQALARRLLDDFGVFTVARKGLAGGACVRVTPALSNRLADLDQLASALKVIAG